MVNQFDYRHHNPFKIGDKVCVIGETYEPTAISRADFNKVIQSIGVNDVPHGAQAEAPQRQTIPSATATKHWFWDFAEDLGPKSDPEFEPIVGSIGTVNQIWPTICYNHDGDFPGDPENPEHLPNFYTVSVHFNYSGNGHTKFKPGEGFSFHHAHLVLVATSIKITVEDKRYKPNPNKSRGAKVGHLKKKQRSYDILHGIDPDDPNAPGRKSVNQSQAAKQAHKTKQERIDAIMRGEDPDA